MDMPFKWDRYYNFMLASKHLLLTPFLLFLIFGCATISDLDQKEKFSDLSKAYQTAILWSDFDYASMFLAEDAASRDRLDSSYENVKVTSFEKKRNIVDAEVNRIELVVEIRYYWMDRMVEKSITDNQVWEWNADHRNWYLTSGLPVFE